MIAINGVDTAVGLASTNNNEPLYRRLLIKFRDREREFVRHCDALLKAGQFDEAARRVHDLRATAGTLGAMEVSHQADMLETALRRGLDATLLAGFMSTIEQALAPVLADLDKLD